MKLTRVQKFSLAFFIFSLLPAYLLAHWRFEENLAMVTDKFAREQTLHLSTDKLLINCERNEKNEPAAYSANHQICAQGAQEHALTSQAMDALAREKIRNDTDWYWNFLWTVLICNLFGLAAYRGSLFITCSET